LPWPWIAFDASGSRLAFLETETRVATRLLERDRVSVGPSFELPAGLAVQGFSLARNGTLLAVATADALVTLSQTEPELRTSASDLVESGFRIRAIAFDRSGERVWLSTEGEKESALVQVHAASHAVIAVLRSAPFAAPSLHELYTHPQDDAVLLLAACGEEGTFARVAGWSDGPVDAIPTELDTGGVAAGFVGFSADGAYVHLAEADELRTHAWPGLHELAAVELADDFISSFSGVVLADRIFIDGQDSETGEDGVMQFDRSAIRGVLLKPPFPSGMWAGRLGSDCLVTVESKGDPVVARVLRFAALLH
jgi:hypothetical protein